MIRPGDILLIRGSGELSRRIMEATCADLPLQERVSHVGVVVCNMEPMTHTDAIVIEALDRVKTCPLHLSVLEAEHWEIWSNNVLADDQRWAVVWAACLWSATSYGYGKILEQALDAEFGTSWFTEQMPQIAGLPICSYLACKAYEEIAVPIAAGPFASSRSIRPRDIADFVRHDKDWAKALEG